MNISKKDFDAQLKDDAPFNGYKIEGNFIVFDNTADLSYQVLPGYKLKDLLTHNPIASYTKLSKDLLLRLHLVWTNCNGDKPNINSSYRSPEYNKTVPGSSATSLHCQGLAIDLGGNPEYIGNAIIIAGFDGELGYYNWGCHIGIKNGVRDVWDKRTDTSITRKVKDFIAPDATRNYTLIAVLALVGLVIFKRIF